MKRTAKWLRWLRIYRWLHILSLVIFAAILLSQPRWLFTLANRLFPGALYAVQQDEGHLKAIALTIDDGPSPATADILSVLDRYDVQATFFNISSHLPRHESIVQQTVNSGHELGNHLTVDKPSIRLSIADFETVLLTSEAALLSYLPPNSQLKWLRPGMGFYNARMVEVAQRHGYQVVLGSTFPYDTHIHSSRFASEFILRTVQSGDIVVLHDGEKRGIRTAKTLEIILPELQKRGYQVTTLSNLTEKN
ncbi:Polysaccharide deacetylase domain protein [Synechococcus sp. PCC 7335]|uniref:chitin deacetylase family protein n=1 Tax=Synechococcus sp. (strain ATCC 29403 / PCC 7335) TaxID=91464 RepID=UPI00017ED563|nr:chitin deacetylase family protein [Synechococcus sp. PCC 7335]EDX86040.1 Polysaccharide deacetylase domain protein [Synechococcus sp. PCC 7335]